MEQRKWYYNNHKSYEVFNVLSENVRFMLVQNDETKLYSFGDRRDFDTVFGFPVNDSCLTLQELMNRLDDMIAIDSDPKNAIYNQIQKQAIGCTNVEMWEAMKSAARQAERSL